MAQTYYSGLRISALGSPGDILAQFKRQATLGYKAGV